MIYSYKLYRIILFVFAFFPGNFNVFSQDSLAIAKPNIDSSEMEFQIGSINVVGNQKTQEQIIIRELTFKVGDCLSKIDLESALEQSKTNLLKLPLFNYVTIETNSNNNLVDVSIIVEERWFIWPQFAIINNERNFNNWLRDKDLSKLDYRLAVKQYNVFGLNHILKIGLSYGYTKELLLGYQNIALDKKQKHLIGFNLSYSQYNSIFYRNFDNKQESFKNKDSNALTVKSFKINYYFRPQIHFQHRFYLSLQYLNASDSLIKTNNRFLAGKENQNSFLEFIYQLIIDKRDSRNYPLSGFWFDITATKTGLGIVNSPNVDFFNIRSSVKEYYHIAGRFYGAHSFTAKKVFESFQPYYYKECLGYEDFLSGFEYYVIDGNDYYLSKNILKFELLPKTISYLNFIPIRKFRKIHYAIYLNTFFDLGYAYEKSPEAILQNTLSNKILYSGGIGLDIATYYDQVFRIECSMNSLKETGVFLHFILPI